ncbi:nitrous oxide-stimulated promoter family protein [Desulfurobacterium atlanticum]|uniref:Nitrous oxide-stimulated promoter n=1 Tax=Desulfurobacterium atlanticum TaxID=240169 RepID=A0A238YH89_9BACT|nr:nitrous oxide-stimulated promoter family protein [Desulfurobacterium atlanticum]SNR70497.1 Nitrous oxide-stimulated promoter [Desulfurobacterium atlanticum]
MSIEKEKKVIRKMIEIYCKGKHKTYHQLCEECKTLLNYSFTRLDLCPFKDNKPSCKKCPIHCYSPEMREKIRLVMKYSGPRMIFYTPLEWLKHKIEEIKHS